MGSSNSKTYPSSSSNSNSNNKSRGNQSNSNYKQVEINRAQEKIERENARCEKLLASAQQSMEDDPGMPNLIDNYAKLRTCCEPNLHCIGSCVDQMSEGWESIMKQMDTIKKFSKRGKEKADTMTELYTDYWYLLFKTNVSVRQLLTECNIQKDNISVLWRIISIGHAGKLSAGEKVAYDECIQRLGSWIKTGAIVSLIGDWKRISARLKTESNDWKELAIDAAAYAARHTWMFIGKLVLGTLGVIGVIAAVATIVILTAGTAAVAGGAVAAGVAVSTAASTGIATGTVIGIAAAVGGAVALGSTAYGYKTGRDYKREAAVVQSNVNSIIDKLENMLSSSKSMENALTNFQISENAVGERLSYLKDDESVYKMKKGLQRLLGCLDKYVKQGEEVICAIDKVL